MRFQKRSMPDAELTLGRDSFPAMVKKIDKAPAAEPADALVRYRPVTQFRPSAFRIARNLVMGAKSSDQIYYQRLGAQVIRRLRENDWATVAVTSPTAGSGSTLTAINLALCIARDYDYTVLLVELNLVKPSFRRVLDMKQSHGIVDHLLDDMPIQEILFSPETERLVVVPAGSPIKNSLELLSSPKIAQLINDLRLRYAHSIIIFDLPPVLETDEAMAFSPFVDSALLVVEEGETRMNDVRQAVEYLRSTNILGVVLNRSVHTGINGRIVSR